MLHVRDCHVGIKRNQTNYLFFYDDVGHKKPSGKVAENVKP